MCRAGEMKKRGTTCFFHHRRRTPGRQQRNNGMTQKRKKKRKKPFCGISLILHSYAFTWGGRASPTPAFLRLGCVEMNTQQSCMFPPPSLHGSLCSRLPSALGKDRGCHQLKRHNALGTRICVYVPAKREHTRRCGSRGVTSLAGGWGKASPNKRHMAILAKLDSVWRRAPPADTPA